MWKNHFDVYVILHHSLRNGLVWTGKRRTFKTWSIVKFELFKTNWLTFGTRNSTSEETHFLPTSFLDLIKLHFGFLRHAHKPKFGEKWVFVYDFFCPCFDPFFFLSFLPFPFFSIYLVLLPSLAVFFLMRIHSIRTSRLKIEKFKEFLKNNFEKDIIGHNILC